VQLVDPTEVLAKRCVAYALAGSGATQAASKLPPPVAGRLRVESAYG
jgi:aspartate racemase